jgi:hypothetical protein
MSLLKRFQEWRADRIRRKNAKEFSAGYRYAVEVLRSKMDRPHTHLHNLVETSRAFDEYSEFDKGVEKAMSDWKAF